MTIIDTKHWFIELQTEWDQLWGKYNWYTFTPIEVRFEYDKMTFGYEFEMWVLGFGLRIRYNTDSALEKFEEWEGESEEELKELFGKK